MKRHIQTPGVRRWWGEDFLELQSESLEVLDNFFAQYGSCIIKGCDVNGNNINPGIVALSGFDPNSNSVFKVARFAGAQNVSSFPVYLTLKCEVENRLYVDQQQHPAVYNYSAELKTTLPTVPHIVITADGGQQFVDVIQDEEHRFVSESEKTVWNRTPYDYVVDSDAKLAALSNNTSAVNVLIKRGEYSLEVVPEGITLNILDNVKLIYAEHGTSITLTCRDDETNIGVITSQNAEIHNLILTTHDIWLRNIICFVDCKGSLNNCKIDSVGVGFKNCENIHDISLHKNLSKVTIFEKCSNVHRVNLKLPETACAFKNCSNVFYATLSGWSASMATYLEGFTNCSNIYYSNCYFEGGSAIGFIDCLSVSNCKSTRFNQSYASSIANNTYVCADTPNGGWNSIITI